MQAGRALRAPNAGFTYVWVMAAIMLLSLGLAAIGPLWADQARREREQDLLRVGQVYAKAIASYYHAAPGSVKAYPPSLDSLLLDTRFVGTYRHIRRLYADPLDPSRAWGIVRAPDGGVRGVFSQSTEAPLRREPLDLGPTILSAASRYSDWHFVPEVDR